MYRGLVGEDPSGLHTNGLYDENCKNLDSSENITFPQSSDVQCLYLQQNSSLCFAILGVSNGFFNAFRTGKFISVLRRRRIVLVDTLASNGNEFFISDDVIEGFLTQSLLISRSILPVVFRGLPLLFFGEKLPFSL